MMNSTTINRLWVRRLVVIGWLFILGGIAAGCDGDDEPSPTEDAGNDVVEDEDVVEEEDVVDDGDTGDVGEEPSAVTLSWDFGDGEQGWEAGYAEYSAGMEDTIEFSAGIEELPDELERDGTGWFFSAHNSSDNLFMFLKRPVEAADGLVANQAYELHYEIEFASNSPTNCVGAGGAPGESVWVKVGGAQVEPEVELKDDFIDINVDIGAQSNGGQAATVAGDVANGVPCEEAEPDGDYVALEHIHSHDFPVETDDEGQLWLLVGTDSGFEGLNTLYYLEIEVELVPVED